MSGTPVSGTISHRVGLYYLFGIFIIVLIRRNIKDVVLEYAAVCGSLLPCEKQSASSNILPKDSWNKLVIQP